MYRVGSAGQESEIDPPTPITGADCFDDRQQVLVCVKYEEPVIPSDTNNAIVAFDRETAEPLWGFADQDGDRVVPRVRAAFHGLIYAEPDDGPVLMNATDGEDEDEASEHVP